VPRPPPPDTADLAARLRVAVNRLARTLRQQDQGDLTLSLSSTLASIVAQGPITLGDLAAREHVTPPSISKLVAKLEDRGLVARRADPRDGRVCYVEATPEGRAHTEANRTRRTAWLAVQLRDLPDDDLARLGAATDVLERLTALPASSRAG
jgi:DNA-binding MarR family transcriptional regulator